LFHGSSQSTISPVFFTCAYKKTVVVVMVIVVAVAVVAVAAGAVVAGVVVVVVVVVTVFTSSFCGESASTYKMFPYVPIRYGQSRD
jgi:hypothetical protein